MLKYRDSVVCCSGILYLFMSICVFIFYDNFSLVYYHEKYTLHNIVVAEKIMRTFYF